MGILNVNKTEILEMLDELRERIETSTNSEFKITYTKGINTNISLTTKLDFPKINEFFKTKGEKCRIAVVNTSKFKGIFIRKYDLFYPAMIKYMDKNLPYSIKGGPVAYIKIREDARDFVSIIEDDEIIHISYNDWLSDEPAEFSGVSVGRYRRNGIQTDIYVDYIHDSKCFCRKRNNLKLIKADLDDEYDRVIEYIGNRYKKFTTVDEIKVSWMVINTNTPGYKIK